jgi:hypothetical protein
MKRGELLVTGAAFAALAATSHANGLLELRPIRPQDFGAVGDGVTDDTVALQNAFDAACLRAQTLLFGPYAYRATRTLRINGGTQATHIFGSADGCIVSDVGVNEPVLELLGTGDPDIRNLAFRRSGANTLVVYRPT